VTPPRDTGVFREVDLTDSALVGRVIAGDVEAFAGLIARYRDRAARYAVRMLGDPDDADEALQDAFVRAYRSLARCEDRERFGAWLLSIVINRCRTIGARTGRRERTFVRDEGAILEAGGNGGVGGGAAGGGFGGKAGALDVGERVAWRDEIARALAQLDAVYREAFLLKHVEELSYEEMATITGVGVSALKMRVKRACEQMRVLLEAAYSP
jgi:RNA polymerase sigma-70 factor (ECF subfamily)